MLYNKDLNVFREGGSHKVNPIGGIPQGVGINGRLNLVEEGETAFDLKNGRYIFSDRLSLRNQMENSLITEFNLPSYIKGKTFAEASKLIDKKFKDRNDNASLKTKETLMERLQEAQEYIKMQNSMKVNSQEVPAISTDIPPGMQEFANGGNLYSTGGPIELVGANYFGGGTEALGAAKGFPTMGAIGAASALPGLINLAKGGGGEDKVASAGSGILSGASAGAAFGPLGAGIGAALGGVAGLIGAGAAKRKRLKKDGEDTQKFVNQSYNTFAFGGELNGPTDPQPVDSRLQIFTDIANKKYNLAQIRGLKNPFPERSSNWSKLDKIQQSLRNGQIPRNLFNPNVVTQSTTPTATNVPLTLKVAPRLKEGQHQGFSVTHGEKINPGITTKDAVQLALTPNTLSIGGFANAAMRFAPVAGNLLQLSSLKKPAPESRDKIDMKYKKHNIDESQFQNIAANQFNNTADALANASGGNQGALRSGILASGLNRNMALSNAYMQADNANRQQNDMAQQFDFGVNRVNLYQSNLEDEVNARNQGAYETEKSRLTSQLFNDIGNIGKERSQMESVARMYGYSWDGKYMRDKEGNIIDKKKLDKDITKKMKKNIRKTKKKDINAFQPLDFSINLGQPTYNV